MSIQSRIFIKSFIELYVSIEKLFFDKHGHSECTSQACQDCFQVVFTPPKTIGPIFIHKKAFYIPGCLKTCSELHGRPVNDLTACSLAKLRQRLTVQLCVCEQVTCATRAGSVPGWT